MKPVSGCSYECRFSSHSVADVAAVCSGTLGCNIICAEDLLSGKNWHRIKLASALQ